MGANPLRILWILFHDLLQVMFTEGESIHMGQSLDRLAMWTAVDQIDVFKEGTIGLDVVNFTTVFLADFNLCVDV